MLHFYKTPGFLKRISKDLVWGIQGVSKDLYITFDDGPIPDLTEYVLDVLDDFEAKATFFCVGENIYKYPDLCKTIINKGHVVGNHTYNHLKGWSTKNNQYFSNIEKCNELILKYQKSARPLFRPPHGQITRSQINSLKEKYNIIMWDILSYDFDHRHSSPISLEKMMRLTKPGSIVVFHDNYKAEDKLKYMLPRFLKHYKERGFNFKLFDSF